MAHVSSILDNADTSTGLVKPCGLDCLHQPAVREYLALYASTGSRGFKVWLQRSGKWHDIVEQVMREEGLPGDLLYLAMIESGFKTRVKSQSNFFGFALRTYDVWRGVRFKRTCGRRLSHGNL